MPPLLSETRLYLSVIVYRRQLPHSGFPLLGHPPLTLKNLAQPLMINLHVLYWFPPQKNTAFTIYMQFLRIWSKFPSHQQGFSYCGSWEETTLSTSQKFARPLTWKISPNRLQHSVEELTPNKISKKEAWKDLNS